MKAFSYYAELKKFTIPASVTTIGERAFHYSTLTSIEFDDKSLLGEIGGNVSTSNKKHCSLSKF